MADHQKGSLPSKLKIIAFALVKEQIHIRMLIEELLYFLGSGLFRQGVILCCAWKGR